MVPPCLWRESRSMGGDPCGDRAPSRPRGRADCERSPMAPESLPDATPQRRSLVIEEAYAFDDVLLVPAYSAVLPNQTDTRTRMTREIALNIPLVAAAMDTVTEAPMDIAMAQAGGIGVIHKSMTAAEQAAQVRRVKKFESGMVVNPVTIHPDQTLADVRAIQEQNRISGIPVVERGSGRLGGIITNRDVRFANDPGTRVYELMTRDNLVTATADITPEQARHLLHRHRIEKL